MTLDEAQRLAEILIARQVPAMNAAGFGHSWTVDVETGRVSVEAACGEAELFVSYRPTNPATAITMTAGPGDLWRRYDGIMMSPAEMQDDGA